jgi:raffinose/stachyose/melibiose transport system permease protein
MVESKSRKYLYFSLFLLPCFILYSIFFIWPFFNGLYISLTNWDGLTPKAPITLDAKTFETDVLAKLKNQSDKDFLLSIYSRSEEGDSYNRLSIGGGTRFRAESLFRKAGYEPEGYKFVGFKNYADILGGKVSESFYPRSFDKSYYNIDSDLPSEIAKADFDRICLSKSTDVEKDLFLAFYTAEGDVYKMNEAYSEFAFEDRIWLIPEVDKDQTIPVEDVDAFIAEVSKASLARDINALDEVEYAFLSSHKLSFESVIEVKSGAEGIYSLGDVKGFLSRKWVEKGFDLGVIGFTLFFAIFSVIGINILAFLLALALDTGLKGQKVLRSVFFLPNVLSMIIVALIWKMLFTQMLPRVTGIENWLSDPVKTPWLIVLVAIWQGAGYYMIVYLAGLQNIPTDVVEAAKIDGASPWQRFTNVTLPLLVPAITISLFLTIANALKSFDLIYAMTSGAAYTFGTVPVVLDIFFDAFARKHAGLATAKAMLLFALILVITGLQLYVMKKKEIEQ